MNKDEELHVDAFYLYGETKTLRDQSLHQLRQMIMELSNPDDQIADTTTKNLLRFLRARRYDLPAALAATIQYQHFLTKQQSFLTDYTKEEILHFQKAFMIFYEPFIHVPREDPRNTLRSKEETHPGGGSGGKGGGRVIIIFQMKKFLELVTPQYKEKNPNFLLRFYFFLYEQICFDIRAQLYGMIIVISCHGLSFWEQLAVAQLAPIQDHITCIQHFLILGTRFKGAFIIEEPPFLSWLWYFCKSMINEKMVNRFHFCGKDHSSLHELISDVKILPSFLGGNRDDEDTGDWLKKTCEDVFRFDELL